jgi:hypothetical protein
VHNSLLEFPVPAAVVLRAAGAYAFLKLAGVWKLIWISATGSQATVYPAITGYTAVGSWGFLRVPQALLAVPCLAYDSYARADGSLGNSEASGPDGQAVNARSYQGGSTWQISSHKALNSPAAGSELLTNPGFESGTNGWSGTNGSLAIIAGGESGNAVELTPTSGGLQRVRQAVTTQLGAWYRIAGFIKSGTSGNEIAKIQLKQTNSPYTLEAVVSSVSTDSWTAYAASGRAGTTSTDFSFEKTSATSGTMLFDSGSMKELTFSELIQPLEAGTADVWVEAGITKPAAADGFQSGVIVRLDSASNPQNFLLVYLDGQGNLRLDKCVGGVYSPVASAAVTYVAGAAVRVCADGASVRVFYNQVSVLAVQTVADAGILSNTLHGLFSTDESNQMDNLTVWSRGNDGAYARLNRFIQAG